MASRAFDVLFRDAVTNAILLGHLQKSDLANLCLVIVRFEVCDVVVALHKSDMIMIHKVYIRKS